MGLLINVAAKYNHLRIDFDSAYFMVEEPRISIGNGSTLMVSYTFTGYINRDIAHRTQQEEIVISTPWGATPEYSSVNGRILYYHTEVPATDVFADGIPATTDGLKTGCYNHFKAYLDANDVPYTDVFEEQAN